VIKKQAILDLDRRTRLGMVEAIWGENKSVDQIVAILQTFESEGEMTLVTRIGEEKANKITPIFDSAVFHPEARC